MDEPQIRFDDGAAYEEFMGVWSRLAGDTFLRWLAPADGWRWADIGCGNGAFTELLALRCAPAAVQGLDPSEAQLAFARARFDNPAIQFRQGDATALPYADDAFDAAVMALVIFFVPDPARAVAEMARVVRPGGSVSSYSWDLFGGGFPFAILQEEMATFGRPPLWPPSAEASTPAALRGLWSDAGLIDVEMREVSVQRSFASFDSWWTIAQTGPRLLPRFATLTPDEQASLKDRLRARLPPDGDGHITCGARAHAIRGWVAGDCSRA